MPPDVCAFIGVCLLWCSVRLLISFLFVGVGALFSLVTASPFRVTLWGLFSLMTFLVCLIQSCVCMSDSKYILRALRMRTCEGWNHDLLSPTPYRY